MSGGIARFARDTPLLPGENYVMPKSWGWKPCDELVPEDFERFPVWAFDTAAEDDPDADETWVRPLGHDGFADISSTLFVRASLIDRNGVPLRDCVVTVQAMIVEGAQLVPCDPSEIESIVLLKPAYDWLDAAGGRVTNLLPSWLAGRLPLDYVVDEPLVGSRRIRIAGSIRTP